MNRAITALGFTAAALIFAAVAFTAPSNGDELLKDERHFLAQSGKTYSGGQKAAQMKNMEVVGHTDLGGRGFNADVWHHDGYAYIGHWGFQDWASGSKNRFCPEEPSNGIAVVDVNTPAKRANPRVVARLQNPAGTSAEDVVVYTAESGPRPRPDIAVAGIQWCGGSRNDPNAKRGLMLWDVSNLGTIADPDNPPALQPIGFLATECCTRGVHEFEVEHRDDLDPPRTFAYATVPTSRYADPSTPSGYRDANGEGDFRLIDITNPEEPAQVSDWGIQDVGGPFSDGQGCDADPNYGHGAEPSDDGRLVFLSYWDSGFIRLNVTDPEDPVFEGRTVYASDEDGDAHSSSYTDDGLLFTADEDFCKNSGSGIETGYGYLRVYDYSSPDDPEKIGDEPEQIGEYRTPSSLGIGAQGSGDYTIHNTLVVGTDVYISWYSDGVRVVDASDPTDLEEVAYFVPPAGQNPVKPPQRGVLSQMPQVWGVVVDETTGLVYASDMNTGLWILRRTDQG